MTMRTSALMATALLGMAAGSPLKAEVSKPQGLCMAARSALRPMLPPRMVEMIEARKPQGIDCVLCKQLVGFIDDWGQENTTIALLDECLDDICKLIPADDQAECRQLIGHYGPEIIQYLFQLLDPDTVCDAIGLCTVAVKPAPVKKVQLKTKQVAKSGDTLCQVCMSVIGEFQKILGEPSDEKQLADDVGNLVCPALKIKSIVADCEEFIEDEGSKLLNWLSTKLDPSSVCDAIDACP